MIIANSSVKMAAASEYYKASSFKKQTATTYHNGEIENTVISQSESTNVEHRVEGSATLMLGFEKKKPDKLDENRDVFESTVKTKPKEKSEEKEKTLATASELMQGLSTSLGTLSSSDPKLSALQKMLQLLQQMRENSFSKMIGGKAARMTARNLSIDMSLSQNSAFMQNTIAISGGGKNGSSMPLNTGYWTRQETTYASVTGSESMAFKSTGIAKTEDGREINFGVTLEMSRSFAAEYLSVGEEREYTPTDPLVINVGAGTAGVSDMTFMFDLNCDGKKEEISSLQKGSAFLALDKNKDGKINDGSELFGAKTGNGFAELSEYDEDGNGWIDEADSIFSSLCVWTKNVEGKDELLAISKAGVGAIYLGSAKADYLLRNSSGEQKAQIRSSGVFLHEDGTAGTIQHVDYLI